jgi:hypothetical protein
MQTKDYNPKESVQIFETVLFTEIVKNDLKKVPLIQIADALMIIADVHDLEIYFSDNGYMLSNNRHFKIGSKILEN